jgi:hypothetical protein
MTVVIAFNLALSGLLSRPSDAAEMREAEASLIFEAIAERAVDADMGEPDHRD